MERCKLGRLQEEALKGGPLQEEASQGGVVQGGVSQAVRDRITKVYGVSARYTGVARKILCSKNQVKRSCEKKLL